jgi:hypothetical protein
MDANTTHLNNQACYISEIRAARELELNTEMPPEIAREADPVGSYHTGVLTPISASGLLSYEFPPRETLLSPWLPSQGLAMLHAYRGVGKTHVALGVASAVATGGKFLTWQAEKPRKVLFLDGEMPGVVLQERLRSTMRDMDKSLADNLIILTPDLQSLGMPDLATTEGQKRLEPYITNDLALIVVDNISTLCRTGQENKADSWQTMQAWALNLRARGKSVMLVHHDGKNGQQRGSSKKEDILDTVIQLKRPADYNSSEGAVFEIRFTKARGLWGEAVAALEAKLVGDEWTTRMVEESTREKVKALLSEGWKQKDIAEELEISKGLVSRYAKDN